MLLAARSGSCAPRHTFQLALLALYQRYIARECNIDVKLTIMVTRCPGGWLFTRSYSGNIEFAACPIIV